MFPTQEHVTELSKDTEKNLETARKESFATDKDSRQDCHLISHQKQ